MVPVPGDGRVLADGSLGDDHSVVAGWLEKGTFTVTGRGGYNLFSFSETYYLWEGKNVEPAEFDNYMSTSLGNYSDFNAKAQLITDTAGRSYDEVLGDLDAGGPF